MQNVSEYHTNAWTPKHGHHVWAAVLIFISDIRNSFIINTDTFSCERKGLLYADNYVAYSKTSAIFGPYYKYLEYGLTLKQLRKIVLGRVFESFFNRCDFKLILL